MRASLSPSASLAVGLFLSVLGPQAPLRAEVVRPAPDFSLGPLAENGNASLKSQRGRPVILLMARSPDTGSFRSQMKEIASRFDRMSTRNVLVVAAFEQTPGPGDLHLVKSDVPVVVVPQGAEVCRQFGLNGKSAIALIGPDGNLDYQTSKTLTASKINQVIGNSFEFQHNPRRKPLSVPSGEREPAKQSKRGESTAPVEER
jgi:hypothetical protein